MTPRQQVAEDLAKIRRPPCTRCRGLMLTEPLSYPKCYVCLIQVLFRPRSDRTVPISKGNVKVIK